MMKRDVKTGRITLFKASKAQLRRPHHDERGGYENDYEARRGSNGISERFLRMSKSSSQTTDRWAAENVQVDNQNLTNIQTPAHLSHRNHSATQLNKNQIKIK
jgi:hypothetical protein